MPGYVGTPFFSQQAIFKEQPAIAAEVTTTTAEAIAGAGGFLLFPNGVIVDYLDTAAWRTVWNATTPGQFTITVRGWYFFGVDFGWAAAVPAATRIHLNSSINGLIHITDFMGAPEFVSASTITACVQSEVLSVFVWPFGVGATTYVAGAVHPRLKIARIG